MIGCSTLVELAQGFGLVTSDPFSRELGGVWASSIAEEFASSFLTSTESDFTLRMHKVSTSLNAHQSK